MSGSVGGAVELSDDFNADPRNQNGTVTIAGTPVDVTASDPTCPIQLALIKNPNKGPNANTSNDVLLINIDDGETSFQLSLARGEYVFLPGNFLVLEIDANNNGTNFEAIVWS